MPLAAIATIIIPPSLSPSYHANHDTSSALIRDTIAAVLHHGVTFEDVWLVEAHAHEELRLDGYNAILSIIVPPKTKRCRAFRLEGVNAIERAIRQRSNGRLKCLTSLTVSKTLGELTR
jgi:hypothetical protein